MTTTTTADQDKPEAAAAAVVSMALPEETHWTDDRIRWEGGLHDNDQNDEHECPLELDIFADPHPQQTFKFPFQLPNSSTWIDIYLDGYKQHSDQIWKSTGLTVWRAAESLCDYLIENSRSLDIQNKSILELGSGLGLVGLVAHKIQAAASNNNNNTNTSCVCLTDGDTLVLKKLRENMDRNRCCNDNDSTTTTTTLSCHQLLWGRESSETFLEYNNNNNNKFDMILGSDLIYSSMVVNPMFETIQTLLNKDGVFVMAFAKRNVPVSLQDVLQACTQHGFVYERVVQDLAANGDSDSSDPAQGVFVYEIKWK